MTKKVDETLKKTNVEKKKTNLRIEKKGSSKTTKKVILEAPILEQASNKKPKRTISRKKPEEKTLGSLNDVKKQEEIKEDVTKTVVKQVEKVEVKEVPKAEKTVKKSRTSLKSVTPKPNSQKNSQLLDTKQILVKPKRTLKLTIDNKITPDEEEEINSIINFENVPVIEATPTSSKKEVTINQNASFFYEPSIFQKFNIEVSNVDEEVVENNTEIIVPNFNDNSDVDDEQISVRIISPETEPEVTVAEPVIENVVVETEELVNNLVEEIIEETPTEGFDFVCNEVPEEFKDVVEKNLELSEQKQKFIENSSNGYDFISTETPDIYKPAFVPEENLVLPEAEAVENNDTLPTETIETDSVEEEKIIDVEDILDTQEISLNDIDISDISLDDIENVEDIDNLIEVDFTSEEELKQESADGLITENIAQEKANSDDTAIGKFFDSSIPNIASETDSSYFKKIKKSLFSNISTVFKKFSYEEASLLNSEEEELVEDASPIIGLTGASTTNDIKQVLENFDNQDNIINNLEVSAEPNTLVLPSIEEALLDTQDVSGDSTLEDTFTNIITPQSDVTIDDLDIDDIDDIDVSDIEEILEQTSGEETISEIDEPLEDITSEDDVELNELSEEDIDKELEEVLGITPDEKQEEDHFSIEEYFGVTTHIEEPEENIEEDFYTEDFDEEVSDTTEETVVEEENSPYKEQMESFSKLIENFSQTISTLSNKITELESNITSAQPINQTVEEKDDEIISEEVIEEVPEEVEITNSSNEEILEEENIDDISLDDISLDDISLDDISLDDIEALENDEEEASLLPTEETENVKSVEDLLLEAFDSPDIDEQMKQDLLSEVLSVEDDLTASLLDSEETAAPVETETTSDFFKIIDSLSKTISELENAPDIDGNNSVADTIAPVPENTSDKAINILINKDDIFSIAISNETYEIVTDFDGISVLSENIHISTPKNNFYVNIGEKYIEIHKQPDLFVVNTNFEDIEFANAINNVTFAKKKNKIELNIKEAFKISSVHKKIELSMLNTSIANLAGTQEKEKSESESSVCDNKTLVINEETQKVYLPYTIEEVMKKLNNSSDYQSLEDVIEHEYTLPLSTFKMPIISRFKEAYRFMRVKEKTSVYAALDLAVELMFNSNLNPAVIRASKDLKELNIYLDCLYENEIEKFDCFKVIYKVLPKIQ